MISPTHQELIMPSGVPRLVLLAIVRSSCRSEGLSADASWLLEASWGSKTTSTNEPLFKWWDSWCQEWGRDPIRGPIVDVGNFLAGLYHQGYQYRSPNSYRSTISSVHKKIDGEVVGKHPLICRLLKGVFNERPPRPKYDNVWNIDLVPDLFRKQGPSESLSLQDLTVKTAMLLALTQPCRGADLAELDINYRSFVPEGVKFTPVHLSKQSSSSWCQFFLPSFSGW